MLDFCQANLSIYKPIQHNYVYLSRVVLIIKVVLEKQVFKLTLHNNFTDETMM